MYLQRTSPKYFRVARKAWIDFCVMLLSCILFQVRFHCQISQHGLVEIPPNSDGLFRYYITPLPPEIAWHTQHKYLNLANQYSIECNVCGTRSNHGIKNPTKEVIILSLSCMLPIVPTKINHVLFSTSICNQIPLKFYNLFLPTSSCRRMNKNIQ